MEADMETPSEFHRFHDYKVSESRFVEWSNKRKLQPDHDEFSLPSLKHNCLNRTSTFAENPELVSIRSQASVEKLEPTVGNSSELESANSNSTVEESDSDSPMAMIGEATQEADCILQKPRYSLSGLVMEKSSSSKDELVMNLMDGELMSSLHDSDAEAFHNILGDDHILGSGDHPIPDNCFYEYEHNKFEHNVEKEFKDVMSLDGANPNIFVLSSGRWSLNQEADSSKRKPTIDQEFEEYFLTLML